MGFFDHLANIWTGFLSLWVWVVGSRNPETVYECAIEALARKHRELGKEASELSCRRNKLSTELGGKESELKDVMTQIPVAIDDGEDEFALALLKKKDELTTSIESMSARLKRISDRAEEANARLPALQVEIEKLKQEKEQMLEDQADLEARLRTLSRSSSGYFGSGR